MSQKIQKTMKTVINRIKIAFPLCSIWAENFCRNPDFLCLVCEAVCGVLKNGHSSTQRITSSL